MNATDNFNRANETPLASPWATSYGGGMNLVSNAAQSTAATDRGSYYTGTWGADQQSEATVGNLVNGSNYAGVLVRAGGAGNAFQVVTDGASGAGHTEFGRWDAGVYTTLGGVATTFANGDRIRLHVSGTSPNIVLTCYKNGAQVGQLTGVTGPNSGNPGVGCYGLATVDDWSADDGAGAPSGPPPGLGGDGATLDRDLAFAVAGAVAEVAPDARARFIPLGGVGTAAGRWLLRGESTATKTGSTDVLGRLLARGVSASSKSASSAQAGQWLLRGANTVSKARASDAAGRWLARGAETASKVGSTDVLGRVLGRGSASASKTGQTSIGARFAQFGTSAAAKSIAVDLSGRLVLRGATSFGAGGGGSTDVAGRWLLRGASTATKTAESVTAGRWILRAGEASTKTGSGAASGRVVFASAAVTAKQASAAAAGRWMLRGLCSQEMPFVSLGGGRWRIGTRFASAASGGIGRANGRIGSGEA